MKWTIIFFPLITCTLLFAAEKEVPGTLAARIEADTVDLRYASTSISLKSDSTFLPKKYTLNELNQIIGSKKAVGFVLGSSKMDREIQAWYFPGQTDKRALVIGGMHGSELSAVEVANTLIQDLLNGETPLYSVIVIPTLFPDNAHKARTNPQTINSVANIGRYSFSGAVDPNRQMPTPGKAFRPSAPFDHVGREIERENQLLLQVIQAFKPDRVANLHAIRNSTYGGVYADPRTDENGIAIGYDADSTLAVDMAAYIHAKGGNVAGNNLKKRPTALYYKDPKPVPAGEFQPRNMTGSVLNANRGSGVSLGTWGSTSVVDEDSVFNRPAMHIITIEYPGCKRPSDYSKKQERAFHQKQVIAFAEAVRKVFLGEAEQVAKVDQVMSLRKE